MILSNGNSALLAVKSCRSTQQGVRTSGHAIEARLYAEDPKTDFCLRPAGSWRSNCRPISGSISGVEAGGEVTPYYDAMVAKLIVHEATREAALDRLPARSIGRCLRGREAMSLSWRPSPGRPNSAKARSIPASSIAIWRSLARCRMPPIAVRQRSGLRICWPTTLKGSTAEKSRPSCRRRGQPPTAFNSAVRGH